MTAMATDDPAKTLLQRVRQARAEAATSGATVLDVLSGGAGAVAEALDEPLRRWAGVQVLTERAAGEPDWAALPRDVARRLRAVLLDRGQANGRCLAMADPWDDDRVREATTAIGYWPDLAAATSALLRHHLGAPPAGTDGAAEHNLPGASAVSGGDVVEFVDAAIRNACTAGASDVHFECDRSGVSVKLRLDGVMAPHARIDDPMRAEQVISRIKVLSQLDITERRTPQDGRFRWHSPAMPHGMDMRVSIMPSIHGEDAVLRLLDKARLRNGAEAMSLNRLGFDGESARRIRELAELPHGMLLVTGPTGSGKTTTLYAVMSELHNGLDKTITIEDPVEYELAGVLQIPVNERKGLTFAKGLRSILRHDPDRILVGEIRDAETAEIAVQSALTGHQVFTTVHANSIHDVMGRFRHFGLDMFGFMSSLNGVVVQRLLRRLCRHCAGVRDPMPREADWLQAHSVRAATVPAAAGCTHCQGSGFAGRGVLAEVHLIDDGLRDLVISAAPVAALRRHVDALGVQGLSRQGAQWVAQGLTTPEEVRRVVGWL